MATKFTIGITPIAQTAINKIPGTKPVAGVYTQYVSDASFYYLNNAIPANSLHRIKLGSGGSQNVAAVHSVQSRASLNALWPTTSEITLHQDGAGANVNTFTGKIGTTLVQEFTAVFAATSVIQAPPIQQAANTVETFTIAHITDAVQKILSEKGTGLVSTDAGVYTKSSTDNMYYLGNNPTTSLSRIKVSTTSGVSYDVQKRANTGTTSAFATKIGLIPSAGSATAFTGRIPAKTVTNAGKQSSTPSLIVPGFTAVLGAANAPPAPVSGAVVIPAPPAPAPVAVVAAGAAPAPVAAPDVTVDVKMYPGYTNHDLHGQFAKVKAGDTLYTKKSPVANQSLFLEPVNGGYGIIMKAQNGDLYTVSDFQVQSLPLAGGLVMVYLPRNMGVGLVSVLQAAPIQPVLQAPPIQPVLQAPPIQPVANAAADTRCSVNNSTASYPGYVLGTCPSKLTLGSTCTITCNSVNKQLTCGLNNELTPPWVACPAANVNPVTPAQNKCNSNAFSVFKLMDGENLSNLACPSEMVAGQSCAFPDCNTDTQKRMRVKCETGKPLVPVTWEDPACKVPVPEIVKRCTVSSMLYPGYMLGGGGALGGVTCTPTIGIDQSCDSPCTDGYKTRVTCNADGVLSAPTRAACPDGPVNPPSALEAKCNSTSYPGYTLLNSAGILIMGSGCPNQMSSDESCGKAACDMGKRDKISCVAGSITATKVTDTSCTSTVTAPLKCTRADMYKGYKQHNGFDELLPQNPQPCPDQMDPGTYCSEPVCPVGTSGTRVRKSITCAESGTGAVTESQVTCTPDLSCARPAGYAASEYRYMTPVGSAEEECPATMATGTRCIQKLCGFTAGKKMATCTDGKITEDLTDTASCAPAPSTCSIGREYTNYKRVSADGSDPMVPCPSPMSIGDVCADLDCPTTGPNAGKRSTITCEKETGATAANLTMKAAGQVPCDFVAPDTFVLVAKLGHVSTEATNNADSSRTIVDGVKAELAGTTTLVGTTGANLAAVDSKIEAAKATLATDPTNTVLQQKVTDLIAEKTATNTELDELRKQVKELAEKLIPATATATRDAVTANTARDNLAAAQGNIGGALPSASDTTLCAELIRTLPGVVVVCAKTGVSWFVSINRGTFQVPVTVYKQLDGSWVGYGAQGAQGAPGAPGAPPWKGVYVTIKPSASRSVPHSVTCAWHYPPPGPTTTVSYTAGVPSTSGTDFQYQLSPTTAQETAFVSGRALSAATSITMFNGNLFPFWPAEATMATATNAPVSSSGGLSTGAIVGIVLACVVAAIALVIFGLVFANRRSARASDYYPPVPYNDRGA